MNEDLQVFFDGLGVEVKPAFENKADYDKFVADFYDSLKAAEQARFTVYFTSGQTALSALALVEPE